jgi:3-deoxy-D-manno-octulosonic-acid transferase
VRAGSLRIVYLCLAYLLVPAALATELVRGVSDRARWRHLGERFGCGASLPPGGIWVHAVSVGEVQAAATLLRALRAADPVRPLLLTSSTVTGRARAAALLAGQAQVRYLPYDLPGAVARFLDRARPCLGVVLETELWPNLYAAARRRGVPLLLASGRLSERSVRRYRRLGGLLRETLAGVEVAAQSAADAGRFVAIGADPARTTVLGNLKFDYAPPADVAGRAAALRAALGAGRPVWVAGSTHEGEEEQVLEAHAALCRRHPGALLVLAPRHPPRFAAVGALLARRGVAWAARSGGAPPGPDTAVFLLDTLGELVAYYAAADVAFVGGSLVPVGGHNLLEPASLGRPVVAGPHTFSDPAVTRLLAGAGALSVVRDGAELAATVDGFWADRAAAHAAGEHGRTAVAANQGALARLVARIGALAAPPAT